MDPQSNCCLNVWCNLQCISESSLMLSNLSFFSVRIIKATCLLCPTHCYKERIKFFPLVRNWVFFLNAYILYVTQLL